MLYNYSKRKFLFLNVMPVLLLLVNIDCLLVVKVVE